MKYKIKNEVFRFLFISVRKKCKRHNHCYCELAVGQSVPEGGEVSSPTARTPEGCVAWDIVIFSLNLSLVEGQQHTSCDSVTLLCIHACKCWPPSGPFEWMDMLKPHGTHPSGVRAVRLTHFVPAGDVLAYGQPASQPLAGDALTYGQLAHGISCLPT